MNVCDMCENVEKNHHVGRLIQHSLSIYSSVRHHNYKVGSEKIHTTGEKSLALPRSRVYSELNNRLRIGQQSDS